MQLYTVNSSATKKQFHQLPHLIYKNDPNWAAPIQGMVENTFNPEKNPSFKNGEAERWVIVNEAGTPLGRIAAFINYDKAKTFEQPTGGCGFFECVDDQEVAGLLFDTARDWLKERGMEAMDGPVNFGENYMNWGLLVDGFMPQGYGMPYNANYYQKLFENYGFKLYFKQFSYHLDYSVPFPERFWKIAGWVAQKPGYNFKHFDYNNAEKFIQDFCYIYDEAWRFHEHFNPLDPQDLRDFIQDSKAVLDPEMIWFAYHDDEPIALFVMVPDINQILQKLNGKLNFINMLKFLYYKKKKVITRTRILIMGVTPKYQRSGIESAIFWHQDKLMKNKPQYTEVELSWAGDFNPKIVSLYESVGGKHVKTHHTMRYLFDRNKPFERAPIIGAEKEQ
ncbi:GNAT family N-acetyltransferase [uncultured Sunxiuqinia sp.]|uniref:GNAT family N-acetyltransferase n=1 Tax=uncultured Sunxiuqinia sp. TaxID=1573825 RepID=UPI00260E5271|nr:GNAT family N-acetyltransferase [uncultured Sunxiuqinia sp.]